MDGDTFGIREVQLSQGDPEGMKEKLGVYSSVAESLSSKHEAWVQSPALQNEQNSTLKKKCPVPGLESCI